MAYRRGRLMPALTLAVGLGIGTLYGSTLTAHVSAAVLAVCRPAKPPAAAPRPKPVHKATPTRPSVHILAKVTGSDNQQTATFRASGPFSIAWRTRLQDTSVDSGFFGVELYDANGTMLDLVANAMKAGDGQSVEHADCANGCYFKITASNLDYSIVAGQ